MNWMRTVVCLCAAAVAGVAEESAGVDVRGEIVGRQVGGVVELRDALAGPAVRCDVDFSGRFEAHGMQPGSYELRVLDQAGGLVKIQPVVLRGGTVELRIDLPGGSAERPPVGTISVERLRNPVPGKARREFNRGVEAASRGRLDQAMTHLRRAIELYPRYFEAMNNLGTCQLEQREFGQAAEVLLAAARIAPREARIRGNLATALAGAGRFREAETAARDALAIEPDQQVARNVLAYVKSLRPRL